MFPYLYLLSYRNFYCTINDLSLKVGACILALPVVFLRRVAGACSLTNKSAAFTSRTIGTTPTKTTKYVTVLPILVPCL